MRVLEPSEGAVLTRGTRVSVRWTGEGAARSDVSVILKAKVVMSLNVSAATVATG
eukprot:CAMPEP_0173459166 /NCGR_PEP_ID=MMETSP1357-20121228/60918_1 /TAXON_ID=77926 /ORGANISM="Hemiselmis rufescens, Strain PCC563" /LENGTH=54 /DNA_ID=CAMNT_0014426599 /DNA_START=84 /DNA_END=244 /DNA_ORIENTATION=-